MGQTVKKTAPFYLFIYLLKNKFEMKTNFTYSFKHNSCTTDENEIDVKAVLDSVQWIVAPHRRLTKRRFRFKDDTRVVHLFANNVPYVAVNPKYVEGIVNVLEINESEYDDSQLCSQRRYNGRMDFESVCLSKTRNSTWLKKHYDCYFSIHIDEEGNTVLYIGNQATKTS